MTVTNLSRRVARVEAKRPQGVPVFMVWGRTIEEATAGVDARRAAGTMSRTEAAAAMVWPDPGPVPSSRRIWLPEGPNGEPDISDRELELLVAALDAEAAAQAKGDPP
jgi:hypothetical protein